MSLVKSVKQIKEELKGQRGENIHADKIGAAVASHFGYQNLRAFWPLSSLPETFAPQDISGQGRHLDTAAVDLTSGLYNEKIPYVTFNGTSSYARRTDEAGLQFTGDFTLGCWVRAASIATIQFLISKEPDYVLYIDNGLPTIQMRDSGGNLQKIRSSVTMDIDKWYNLTGINVAGGLLSIGVNGVWDSVSAQADVQVSGVDLYLGSDAASQHWLDGDLVWPFITAAAASQTQVRQHFASIKTSFKVYT